MSKTFKRRSSHWDGPSPKGGADKEGKDKKSRSRSRSRRRGDKGGGQREPSSAVGPAKATAGKDEHGDEVCHGWNSKAVCTKPKSCGAKGRCTRTQCCDGKRSDGDACGKTGHKSSACNHPDVKKK